MRTKTPVKMSDIAAKLGVSIVTVSKALNDKEDGVSRTLKEQIKKTANEMGYKKSSVSIAMKNLREAEHIRVTKEGYIYLTDSGKEIAEMIYERHQILSSWLIKLGVDKKVAEEDACRIEHDISKESFNAIKKAISAQLKELENNK